MPPKKQQQPSKTDVKKKEKIAEDKTFGMKNKKGKKQQEQIKQIKQQVIGNQVEQNKAKEAKKKLQEEKKARESELNLLFRPAAQKVGAGADPKSVLCSFFVQGTCQKGAKCKFSHDMSLANKSEKRSLYSDERDEEEKKDGMDQWDQSKLEEVIAERHGTENKQRQTSDQICKHFLKAVEKNVYGWFWNCPNGEKCLYKHCLPQGFILKRDASNDAAKKDEISLEELIDIERKRLGPNTTKVTLETFMLWKNKKLEEKKVALIESTKKKNKDFKSGRLLGFSGREMFTYKPELMIDDEEAEDEIEREVEEDEYEGEIHEVAETVVDIGDIEDEEEEEAGPAEDHTVDNVPIDEALFVDEGLEDLDLDDSDDD